MSNQKAELLWYLAKTDFKLRYNRTIAGYLWSLAKPLATFIVLSFVFQHVFRMTEHYALRVITGLVFFFFFAESTTFGMNSLLHRGHLIVKTSVSKWILVFSSVLNSLISLGINLIILAVFYIIFGVHPSILAILHYFLLVGFLIIIVSGLALFLAPLNVKYRDISQGWEVLLTIFMYSAPIIFPLSAIPGHLQKFLFINPLTPVVYYAQELLINNKFPPIYIYFEIFFAFSCILLFAVLIFNSLSQKTAEHF
ncbi:MAG: type transport system permease protein [Bacteroidota bacterium]|nr:type transport system permease protein [Bacteroidota bacterium]